MQVVALGLSHRSAPLAIRERLAFQRDALPDALVRLKARVGEGFVLSTCNRVEVYALAGHADSGARALEDYLADARGVSGADLRPHLYSHGHDAAVRHLFRVAAGIDSMVLGEEEILGQVRTALEAARAAGTLGPVFSRLGDAAIRAGREVRARTALPGGRRSRGSLVSLAINAAQQHRSLHDAAITVLGAGATASAVLEHLANAGVPASQVTMASRTFEAAAAVAEQFGARAVHWNDRLAQLAASDVVISCTAAPGYVVAADDLDGATREVLCVDLGVPRDIDPMLASRPRVVLLDLDSLRSAAYERRAAADVAPSDAIVAAEVDRFMGWWRSREVVPTITSLRDYATAIGDAEVERALRRLRSHGVENVELVMRGLAERITTQLLHHPLTALKRDPEAANMATALRQLFGLNTNILSEAKDLFVSNGQAGPSVAPLPQEMNLFSRAARLERTERTPIWLMRQAGRILPEYRALRERWGLLEICHQPELCAEVTLQPMRRMPLDAAVLFADIMLPLAAVGVDLDLVDNVGPVIRHPITDIGGVLALRAIDPAADVPYVLETIRIVKHELGPERGVIGFAGAPFTLASYLIEGKPSREFSRTKAMMYGEPALWHTLMDRLTAIMTEYLRAQIGAGVDAIQLFDSWVGCLSARDYAEYVRPYSRRIFEALRPTGVPMIHFGTNTAALLDMMSDDGATIIGVDWRLPLDEAWNRIGHDLGIQGNLDPATLLAPRDVMEAAARDVLQRAGGRPGHIFNLGHGVLPSTPLDNVMRLVDFVQSANTQQHEPPPARTVSTT